MSVEAAVSGNHAARRHQLGNVLLPVRGGRKREISLEQVKRHGLKRKSTARGNPRSSRGRAIFPGPRAHSRAQAPASLPLLCLSHGSLGAHSPSSVPWPAVCTPSCWGVIMRFVKSARAPGQPIHYSQRGGQNSICPAASSRAQRRGTRAQCVQKVAGPLDSSPGRAVLCISAVGVKGLLPAHTLP